MYCSTSAALSKLKTKKLLIEACQQGEIVGGSDDYPEDLYPASNEVIVDVPEQEPKVEKEQPIEPIIDNEEEPEEPEQKETLSVAKKLVSMLRSVNNLDSLQIMWEDEDFKKTLESLSKNDKKDVILAKDYMKEKFLAMKPMSTTNKEGGDLFEEE